jgi:single-stranded-DNA-specific exonuclease
LLENKVLFVRLDEDDVFPPELNGLIAMQLSARYKRPTIVARLNREGYDRGSARGLNQSELKDFKQFLIDSGMFEYAQGHANAFGVSIPDAKLRDFHTYANQALSSIDFGENVYDVHFARTSDAPDLSELVIDVAKANGIWGQGNPEPLIYIEGIPVNSSNYRVMGSNADTIKIEYNGMSFLKFKARDFIDELKQYGSCTLNIIGRANLNEWGGRVSPQMFIDDYEIE